MDVLLMVDPADEKIVGEAIEAIDNALVSGPPQSRRHMDAQYVPICSSRSKPCAAPLTPCPFLWERCLPSTSRFTLRLGEFR